MQLNWIRNICRVLLVAVAAASACGAHAAGLGAVEVLSGLGQPLRAHVPLLGATPGVHGHHCTRVQVETLDGMRLSPSIVQVQQQGQRLVLEIQTAQNIHEPAVNISVTLACEEQLQRRFQVLLDPVVPLQPVQAPVLATAAQVPDGSAGAAAAPTGASVATRGGPREQRKAVGAPWAANAPSATSASMVLGKDGTARAGAASSRQPQAAPKPAVSRPPKAKPAQVRSVLRLSAPDEDLLSEISPRLKMDEQLRLPVLGAAGAMAELDVQKRQLVVATDAEEIVPLARMAVDTMRGELTSLQAELQRLQQEHTRLSLENQAQKAALDAARDQPFNWVIGIGVLIAIGLVAIIWLLWRFIAMQKAAAQIPWNEFDTLNGPEQPLETVFGASAFHPSAFGSTVLGEETRVELDKLTGGQDGPELLPVTDDDADSGATAVASRESDDRNESRRKSSGSRKGSNAALMDETGVTGREPALKAEEISDVMELVEVWMALNKPAKVLELLKPFNDVDRPQSPLPWLCLLDVYRTLGDREKYEAILRRIRNIYNVRLAAWNDRAPEGRRSLADYPHVVEQIVTLWKTDQIRDYLDRLLHDNRDGEREGFDLPVYRDILRLIALIDNPDCDRSQPAMDGRAYAILFALHEPASATSSAVTTSVDHEGGVDAPAPRRRERPKYITPSYERVVLETVQEDAPEGTGNDQDDVAIEEDVAFDLRDSGGEEPVTSTDAGGPVMDAITPVAGPVSANDTDLLAGLVDEQDLSPMAIKLHLALAYQDIGDVEGAALLLEEVIEHGTPELSDKARLILAKFAA